MIRKIDPGYNHYHALELAQEGLNNLYTGLSWQINKRWSYRFYLDLSRQLWIPQKPSSEAMHKLSIKLANATLSLRIKERSKRSLVTVHDEWNNSQQIYQTAFRHQTQIQLNVRPAKSVEYFSRATFNIYHQVQSQLLSGNLVQQRIKFKTSKYFKVVVQWSFFDTPDYDTRVIIYDYDVPGSYQFKQLYGRGTHSALLLTVAPKPGIKFSAWLGYTLYDDKNLYGSGWDAVSSQHEHDISLQLDWQL